MSNRGCVALLGDFDRGWILLRHSPEFLHAVQSTATIHDGEGLCVSCYESHYRRAYRWVYNDSGASNSSTAARDYEGVEVEASSFVSFLDAHCLLQVSLSSGGKAIHRTFSVVYAAMAHGERDFAVSAPHACASPKACGLQGLFPVVLVCWALQASECQLSPTACRSEGTRDRRSGFAHF